MDKRELMYQDEIIDALHQVRDAYAARFHYDLDAIYKDIKEQEQQERLHGRVLVTLPPKPLERLSVQDEQPKAA